MKRTRTPTGLLRPPERQSPRALGVLRGARGRVPLGDWSARRNRKLLWRRRRGQFRKIVGSKRPAQSPIYAGTQGARCLGGFVRARVKHTGRPVYSALWAKKGRPESRPLTRFVHLTPPAATPAASPTTPAFQRSPGHTQRRAVRLRARAIASRRCASAPPSAHWWQLWADSGSRPNVCFRKDNGVAATAGLRANSGRSNTAP